MPGAHQEATRDKVHRRARRKDTMNRRKVGRDLVQDLRDMTDHEETRVMDTAEAAMLQVYHQHHLQMEGLISILMDEMVDSSILLLMLQAEVRHTMALSDEECLLGLQPLQEICHLPNGPIRSKDHPDTEMMTIIITIINSKVNFLHGDPRITKEKTVSAMFTTLTSMVSLHFRFYYSS